MKAVVVYESMYGNTHRVADAIGRGVGRAAHVEVVPVARATEELIVSADLLVVGGPTHAHGMSRTSTRKAAIDQADKQPGQALDPDAGGAGLRDWLDSLGSLDVLHAACTAFDTRAAAPAPLTGRASKGIAKRLRRLGLRSVAKPESFVVDKANHLKAGEEIRAERWGEWLATQTTAQEASR